MQREFPEVPYDAETLRKRLSQNCRNCKKPTEMTLFSGAPGYDADYTCDVCGEDQDAILNSAYEIVGYNAESFNAEQSWGYVVVDGEGLRTDAFRTKEQARFYAQKSRDEAGRKGVRVVKAKKSDDRMNKAQMDIIFGKGWGAESYSADYYDDDYENAGWVKTDTQFQPVCSKCREPNDYSVLTRGLCKNCVKGMNAESFSADAEHFDDVAPLDGPCLHCGNDMFTEAHKSWFCDRESGGCGIVAHFVNPFEAESFSDQADNILETLDDSDEYTQAEALHWIMQNGYLDGKTMCVNIIELGDSLEQNRDVDFEIKDAESFSADSKFKEPYMKGGKLDMKRGNDGKFRRRLVVPLEKNQ
tara:strand:- start:2938 stop:4011 length:1074 start_codon:yes stop_codon:yes gene_type:complete